MDTLETKERLDTLLCLMEEELYREHLTLDFNDAWLDIEELAKELEDDEGGGDV